MMASHKQREFPESVGISDLSLAIGDLTSDVPAPAARQHLTTRAQTRSSLARCNARAQQAVA